VAANVVAAMVETVSLEFNVLELTENNGKIVEPVKQPELML
jgi:hypothetical protein